MCFCLGLGQGFAFFAGQHVAQLVHTGEDFRPDAIKSFEPYQRRCRAPFRKRGSRGFDRFNGLVGTGLSIISRCSRSGQMG